MTNQGYVGNFTEGQQRFFEEVSKLVDDIPMTDVAKSIGIKVRNPKHYTADGICPFHSDKHFGSFKICNRRKFFKCFSCGEFGTSNAKLVSRKENIPFAQAVMVIALNFKIVSTVQYNQFFQEKISDSFVSEMKKSYFERKIENTILIKDVEVRNKVYNTLALVYNRLNNGKGCVGLLKQEHYDHLKYQRLLSDEQIERTGYFTMPKPNDETMELFVELLMERRIIPKLGYWKDVDLSILKGIPGFFQYKSNKMWSFAFLSGIALPYHDASGRFEYFQVRLDNPTKDGVRYLTFSSSNAIEEDEKSKKMNGVGTGVALDTVLPSEVKSSALFITEGKFKAELISETFKCATINVPGVTSWRGIDKRINDLLQTLPIKPTVIYIAFDADMAHNVGVAAQAMKLTQYITKKFPSLKIVYAMWDVRLGKGIDDMMISGYRNKLQKMPANVFNANYEYMLQGIEANEGVSTANDFKNFPKERLVSYYNLYVFSKLNENVA